MLSIAHVVHTPGIVPVVDDAYVVAGQLVQLAAPTAELLPAAQVTQVLLLLAPTAVEDVPDGHGVHTAAAIVSA
jgi:hypothetical protein